MEQIKLFLIIALLWSLSAYGGGVSSGGGLGVVYEKDGVVDKVVLLDLYRNRIEGFGPDKEKRQYKIDQKLGKKSLDQLIHADGLRWFEGLERQFGSEALKIIIEVWRRVDEKHPTLAVAILKMHMDFGSWDFEPAVCQTKDFGQSLELSGGELKNIACRELKKIRLNYSLFNALSPRHRAALWFHEMLYGLSSHADSVLIQELVAYFFSLEFKNEASENISGRIMERFKMYYLQKTPTGIDLGVAGPSFSLLDGGPTTHFYDYRVFFDTKNELLNGENEYLCGVSKKKASGLEFSDDENVYQIPLTAEQSLEFDEMVKISTKLLRSQYPRVVFPTSWIEQSYFTCYEKDTRGSLNLRFIRVEMSTLMMKDNLQQERAEYGRKMTLEMDKLMFDRTIFVGHIQYIVNFN